MSISKRTLLILQQDLITAARIGDVTWLESTVKKINGNDKVLELFNEKGLTCFHVAALECNAESLQFLLEYLTFDVNLLSKSGAWTALHLCINNDKMKKSLKCLQYLIENGADIGATTNTGLTPLHFASSLGMVKHVKYLLQSSNDTVDVVDAFGQTPYTLAMLWGHREVARVLAHQMWLKRKTKESAANNAVDKFMQSLNEELKASEEMLKIKRNLKVEECYKEWYKKNKFVYDPLLFGPISKEERAEITKNFLSRNVSLVSSVEALSQRSYKVAKTSNRETQKKETRDVKITEI